MLDYYKITLPTPEVALNKGLKPEGMGSSFHHWLMGVEYGIKVVESSIYFQVVKSSVVPEKNSGYIVVATDSRPVIDSIMNTLMPYGVDFDSINPEDVGLPKNWIPENVYKKGT